ncbi:MAG: thiamine diphosphokinase [Clostridia bacterium]|nr:thiamine diphosphokinase [Clostridia bacterium]
MGKVARCVIIAGGLLEDPEYISAFVTDDDFVICADSGRLHAERMNILPDLIVGDFDSSEPLEFHPCEVITLPTKKDDTDTGFALKTAIKRGFQKVIILCACGGRLDHTYANLQLLAYACSHGCDAEIIDEKSVITMISSNDSLHLSADNGRIFSVFSYSDKCTVSISGVHYPLTDSVLENSFPLGISNEIEAECAQITVKTGFLLVIQNRKI